jgi:hypothetical protein
MFGIMKAVEEDDSAIVGSGLVRDGTRNLTLERPDYIK